MLISTVQQKGCYTFKYILFHILFNYALSQDIEYNSLCSTVGPCCLSTLYIVWVCSPQTPSPPLPHPLFYFFKLWTLPDFKQKVKETFNA